MARSKPGQTEGALSATGEQGQSEVTFFAVSTFQNVCQHLRKDRKKDFSFLLLSLLTGAAESRGAFLVDDSSSAVF